MGKSFIPLSLMIGSRFGSSKKKTGFVSFITLSSIIGIAIGVIALTVGLSAMNGFERELEDRKRRLIGLDTGGPGPVGNPSRGYSRCLRQFEGLPQLR